MIQLSNLETIDRYRSLTQRKVWSEDVFKEADGEKLEELAREIKEELKPLLYMIPWAAEVEVVKVSSE